MRKLFCILSMSLLVAASTALAQEEPQSDVQRDGLAGPVKTESTVTTRSNVKWSQPGGPTLVLPVWCMSCAYESDGTKTVSGQIADGKFVGELIDIRRDANGRVTERTFTSTSTGKVYRHQIVGPFGATEETDYDPTTGKLSATQTMSYDEYGHMHDWLSLDGDGKMASHNAITRLKDGTLTEETVWGKNGELTWQQTYDPDRDLEHFTTYDDSGAVKLTWTFAHGEIVSFWEQPGKAQDHEQFGEGFIETNGQGNVDNYRCHSDGQCDRSRVHFEYLDAAKKRNPTSAEWRDASGNLLFAAYCEYELDAAGNWTHRKVWVYPSEQGDRALYEDDDRTMTYWQK
jgi:hypothetical protein